MNYNYNDFVVLCLWFNRLGENLATTCANMYVQKTFVVKVVWFLNFCKKLVFWSLFLCHKLFGQFTGEESDINLRHAESKTLKALYSLGINVRSCMEPAIRLYRLAVVRDELASGEQTFSNCTCGHTLGIYAESCMYYDSATHLTRSDAATAIAKEKPPLLISLQLDSSTVLPHNTIVLFDNSNV
uniref:Uncharacterized protein n=1 Tax=Glossina pallidipes TaxID=7398 RepID=A0A1B0AB23_GLOPL